MIGESMAWWGDGGYWPEYVPVATRIAKAQKAAEKLRKNGVKIQPVKLAGRKIASSFWGKGWCDHMDSFRDYENRLPRGRSYVRNGSVVHLDVAKGKITALVAGTGVYTVEINVELLAKMRWDWIKSQCAGQIASLMDLLKGKLSDGVMRVVIDRENGLFPGPKEIKMRCSCPDIAGMCKHIAAVFYGVGARLDNQPELLFLLRGVDHAELATGGGVEAVIGKGRGAEGKLADADLAEVFGIELVDAEAVLPSMPISAVNDEAAMPARVSRTSAANSRRKRQKSAGTGKSTAATKVDDSDTSHPAIDAGIPPKTGRRPQKGVAGALKEATTKSKPPAAASRRPKSKAVSTMPRQSTAMATARNEAKRLKALERLAAEYAASKKEKKPAKSAKKRKGK